ncbi:TRAP transporter small permease [Massilia solisilvae]|uniref:TRAP transporter small permease protein n=1 Tax=Massilia solisilvae TaxID=1811225 RepID=A0ABT2BKZ3_9BURK|nr:TRAP transporter small permease [Massilia solisilvae]MCS0609125.1 TRAP transporter small permease [Massilia solisilvae]
MQEPRPHTPYVLKDSFGPFGNLLLAVARAMAIVGGAIFVILVIMSVTSIVGRKLFDYAVPGDVEILQMLAACASASFFPYCHMLHGDVKVDFFTHNLAQPTQWRMDAIGSLFVCLFAGLIAWRSAAGAITVMESGETSPILAWPVWIPQALMVPGFAAMAVIALYMCVHQFNMAGRAGEGALQ